MMQGAPSYIAIAVSANNVRDRDVFSKSDPVAVLFVTNTSQYGGTGKRMWNEVGRTEQIRNNLNPKFNVRISVPYFQQNDTQHMKLSLYDVDNRTQTLNKQDKLGSAEFQLKELVQNGMLKLPLYQHRRLSISCGAVFLECEQASSVNNDTITIQFEGKGIESKDLFSKSDPFLEIHRPNSSKSMAVNPGTMLMVHTTEYLKNNPNPVWAPITLQVDTLNGGNFDLPLMLKCMDYDHATHHDIVGTCTVTTNQIIQALTNRNGFTLTSPKKKRCTGVIHVRSCVVNRAARPNQVNYNAGNMAGIQQNYGNQPNYGKHAMNSSYPVSQPTAPPFPGTYGAQNSNQYNSGPYGAAPPPIAQPNMYANAPPPSNQWGQGPGYTQGGPAGYSQGPGYAQGGPAGYSQGPGYAQGGPGYSQGYGNSQPPFNPSYPMNDPGYQSGYPMNNMGPPPQGPYMGGAPPPPTYNQWGQQSGGSGAIGFEHLH